MRDEIEALTHIPPISFHYFRPLHFNPHDFLPFTLLWNIKHSVYSLIPSGLSALPDSAAVSTGKNNWIDKHFPTTIQAPWCFVFSPNFLNLFFSQCAGWSNVLVVMITIQYTGIHNYINSLTKHHNLQYTDKLRILIPALNMPVCGVKQWSGLTKKR